MVANGINGINGNAKGPTPLSSDTRTGSRVLESLSSSGPAPTLLSEFIALHEELDAYRNGKAIKADGQTLSIAAVTAVARYHAHAILDDSLRAKERVAKAREVVSDKVTRGTSIYGLSTGFGGSADTRTDKPVFLGLALLQHLHAGVLPSSGRPSAVLPLHDPLSSMSMPESWVRAAMLIRMNSFVRGHSGVRWGLIEKLGELLSANITPMVPLRGTISASGDLTALSYIGGTLMANPAIRVFHGPGGAGPRQTLPSREALRQYNIEPLPLASKEHLSILNGTAFSAAVAALAMNDAVHLTLLGQVCTAMGTEALTGTRGSFDPFIHATARPHPGQIEFAQNVYGLLEGSKFARLEEEEVGLRDDTNLLRQDRYPLRTSPQFLGPQIEDILAALRSVTQECNSTTDNPLVDSATGKMHHGGNFQAMAVTNAMEKTRLALHHVGKLIFAQCTELLNPAMNNGLPPSLAATDPSLNYFAKGIDAATASYVSELGFLANPVSTHIQSAEMHNQAVNSLALISARATVTSIDVLTMLISSYLYVLCQALDLRTLQFEFTTSLKLIIDEELASAFASSLTAPQIESLAELLFKCMKTNLDKTTTMDNSDRMRVVVSSATPVFIDFFSTQGNVADGPVVNVIDEFRTQVAGRATTLLDELRKGFLSGARGPAPAQSYLNKTRPVYEFIRVTLGVPMHGVENYSLFENGLGVDDLSIGQNISIIHEAIRDGQLQPVIVSLFHGAV